MGSYLRGPVFRSPSGPRRSSPTRMAEVARMAWPSMRLGQVAEEAAAARSIGAVAPHPVVQARMSAARKMRDEIAVTLKARDLPVVMA